MIRLTVSLILMVIYAVILTAQPCDFKAVSAESPSWSPDGKKIAYSSNEDGNYEIYIIQADGTNPQQVTHSTEVQDHFAYFSPYGEQLVYVGFKNDYREADIFKYNLKTRQEIQLSPNGEYYADPHWSPDGQSIVYYAKDDSDNDDIYIMSSDGSNIERLTTHPARDYNPKWSPDGKSVIFVSKRMDGREDFFRINIVDRKITNITQDDNLLNFMPDYAPDNRWIAYAVRRYVPPELWEAEKDDAINGMEIWKMDLEKGTKTQLTHNNTYESGPSWSPDGKKIAFTSCRDNHREIYIMNADGKKVQRLTLSK